MTPLIVRSWNVRDKNAVSCYVIPRNYDRTIKPANLEIQLRYTITTTQFSKGLSLEKHDTENLTKRRDADHIYWE